MCSNHRRWQATGSRQSSSAASWVSSASSKRGPRRTSWRARKSWPDELEHRGTRLAHPIRMRIQRILVPIDFSDPSRFALCAADELALELDASLTLFHVNPLTTVVVLDWTYVPPAE